jgi:hypothetical protein
VRGRTGMLHTSAAAVAAVWTSTLCCAWAQRAGAAWKCCGCLGYLLVLCVVQDEQQQRITAHSAYAGRWLHSSRVQQQPTFELDAVTLF